MPGITKTIPPTASKPKPEIKLTTTTVKMQYIQNIVPSVSLPHHIFSIKFCCTDVTLLFEVLFSIVADASLSLTFSKIFPQAWHVWVSIKIIGIDSILNLLLQKDLPHLA